jgi:site-specific DNA-cytosine methylase
VREAFRKLGHDAWSCDLLDAEDGSPYHYKGDVFDIIDQGWDLMIAHPPCTHLAVSGARHFAAKIADGRQQAAIEFFTRLANSPIERIAIENPVCIMSTKWRKPDQTIQPWMFGHGETKATCLWLKNLPKLVPTNIVEGREQRIHKLPPSPDRWKVRDRTFAGIAEAMAAQWGGAVDKRT